MPKLNRRLVTSLIEDVGEFTEVANEMCSWIGKVEYLSWRFPTRFARNVNAVAIVERHKGTAGEMYILLLEMAYDRMHFVLRLAVEFMDGYPFVEDFFKVKEVGAEVKRPGNMSLANVIRTLWHRLKSLQETIARNTINTKHQENSVFEGRTSRGCQASGSFFYCESCSHASKAVKDTASVVSTALQECNLSSVILAEREVIVAELFEKTQWGVMTKLVKAVDADVETLLKTTSAIRVKSEADSKEHEKSRQGFAAELEKCKTEKTSLEMEIRESTDQLHAVECQLLDLKDTNVKLNEENRALTESLCKAKEKSSNSEILLSVNMQQMAEMAESKMALEKAVKYLREEISDLRRASVTETEKLRKSLLSERLRAENRYHEEVASLKQRHAKIVEELEEETRISASACVESNSTEAETQTEEIKEAAEILTTKGDPEIDMTQQLASNEEAIGRLARQNERLSKTLTRLREHRRIFQIRKIKEDENLATNEY